MALKQLRKELGLKQKDMASLMGTDATTMNRWETGKYIPKPETAKRILELAKERKASKLCQENLREALFPRPFTEEKVNDLRNVEISLINELANNSVNGILVLDQNDYSILYANNKISEFLGISLEEVETKKCYELTHDRTSPCLDCATHMVKKNQQCEWEFTSARTGRHFLVRGIKANWNGKEAQIKYFTDMTEIHQLKTEKECIHESLKFAAIFSEMSVFQFDIKSHCAYMITEDRNTINMPKKIENYPEAIYEEGILSEPYLKDYKRMVSDIESGKKESEIEIEIENPTGEKHWTRFRMNVSGWDEQGKPETAVCSVQVIDEEKSIVNRVRFEHRNILEKSQGLLTYVVSNLSQNITVEERDYEKQNLPKIQTSYNSSVENRARGVLDENDRQKFRKLHDRERLLNDYENGIQTYHVEYQLQLLNGNIIWARNNMNLYREPATGDVYLYEYWFNIFEQKLFDAFLSAANIYHYEAYGMLLLDSGQLTKVTYLEGKKGHKTEIVLFQQEVRKLCEQYVVKEDLDRCLKYSDLSIIKEKLESKRMISIPYHIRMQNGEIHLLIERISWYDKAKGICFVSIEDVDKTEIYEE